MEYGLNAIQLDYNSEIVGEIDDDIELSFVYKNNSFYIEYYDIKDEDYFLIEMEDDTLPLVVNGREITLDDFQKFKNIIGV